MVREVSFPDLLPVHDQEVDIRNPEVGTRNVPEEVDNVSGLLIKQLIKSKT